MTNKVIRSAEEIVATGIAPSTDYADLAAVAQKYAVAITPHVAGLLQHEGIRQQFVPSAAELVTHIQDMADPIGDQTNSPIKGIIHRYPDRCLLQPVNVCPVYCRVCFRRVTVGKGNPALTPDQLEECYAYIRAHPEIWEVILSGGEPLIMKPQQLQKIITALDQIEHVEIIRIHTRVPVVDPERINDELVAVLRSRRPVYVILHCNHPDEFSPAAVAAIEKLIDNGIVMLGQSVLLKGINDDIATLGKLMRTMVKHRIKPYYLHHVDLAKGTSHFRTTIEDGQALVAELRGRYSGLCQPEYVLDIPGGVGKSPIGPSYVTKKDGKYQVRNYLGEEYAYSE
jgi:lysine 2,3-aminomutase